MYTNLNMVFLQIHNGSENILPSKNVTRDLLVLSLDYLLTKSEYFLCSDSVFDLFASRMFGIVFKKT